MIPSDIQRTLLCGASVAGQLLQDVKYIESVLSNMCLPEVVKTQNPSRIITYLITLVEYDSPHRCIPRTYIHTKYNRAAP